MFANTWLQRRFHDFHYAIRRLYIAPVFTLAVMLTLGLGIGATTAIFSLIEAVMLRSLPVIDPSHLYRIGSGNDCCTASTLQGNWQLFSYSLFKAIQNNAPEFDNVTAFQHEAGVLSVREQSTTSQARPLLGEYVSGNYFQTFGLQPFAGRLLTPEDDQRNSPPVAVLSYGAWKRYYNSNPSIIGSTFSIETYPFTIIGIAPPGYNGETLSTTPTEIWVTLQSEFLIDGKAAFNLIPSQAWLHVMGHLRRGANVATASPRFTATLQHWLMDEAALPPENRPQSHEELARQTIHVAPGGSGIGTMREAYAGSLHLLFALCLAVLLIACANIANLLMVRGIAHRPYIAMQLALGASRRRILSQAFTESFILALLGSIAGICIAWPGARLILYLSFRNAGQMPIDVRPSLPVLGFCVGLSLATGLIFGMAPAWLASRIDPIETLRGANRSSSRGAALPQKILLIVQATLSVLLISAAGMLTHSIMNLQDQNLGFRTADRVNISIEPPLADYTLERLTLLYRDLELRLSSIPGVHSASLALNDPVSGGWRQTVVLGGEGMPPLDGSHSALWNRVSPSYFNTMGLPILKGRGILQSDRVDTPNVAVVNETFVKRFFPNQAVLGKRFGFALPAYGDSFEIVGVAPDTKSGDLRLPPQPMAFGALAQHVSYAEETMRANDKWDHFINGAQLYFSGDLGTLEPRIREAFREADPNLAIIDIRPTQQLVDLQFDQQRAVAQLSGLFGALALVLASIGIYGVLAYAVARQANEIGIRLAIGASRMNIVGIVIRGAFVQVCIGLALGIPCVIALAKTLSSKLYHVGVFDPSSLTIAVGSLLAGAFIASVVPAYRAARIDPIHSLHVQ